VTLNNPVEDFIRAATALIERIRTKDRAAVRIRTDDTSRKILLSLSFAGAGDAHTKDDSAMEWAVGMETLTDHNIFNAPVVAAEHVVEKIRKDLEVKGLVYKPPFRVVKRRMRGANTVLSGVEWETRDEETIWDGFSVDDYAKLGDGRIGRIEGADTGNVLIKIVLVMQELQNDRWADMAVQPKSVSPAKVTAPTFAPNTFTSSLDDTDADDNTLSATERKRQRQQQAIANRSQNVQLDPEEQRRREERRIQAEREAEERRKRAEEERIRQQRLDGIQKSAEVSWEEATLLVKECVESWVGAAMHEAESRDAQVEAELFGGGETIDSGEKWVEAENRAQALLEFAQERIEEARARRAGEGFEAIYGDDELADGVADNEGIQEHTDESEFEAARQEMQERERERLQEDMRREAEAAVASLSDDPPETGDDLVDAVVSGVDHAIGKDLTAVSLCNPFIPKRPLPLPGVPDPSDPDL
jgi:hypothetical protein